MKEVTAAPLLPKPRPRLRRFCDRPSREAICIVSVPMRTAPMKKYPMGNSSHGQPTRKVCCAPNEKKNIAVALPSKTKLIAGMGHRSAAGTRSVAKLSTWSAREVVGPRNLASTDMGGLLMGGVVVQMIGNDKGGEASQRGPRCVGIRGRARGHVHQGADLIKAGGSQLRTIEVSRHRPDNSDERYTDARASRGDRGGCLAQEGLFVEPTLASDDKVGLGSGDVELREVQKQVGSADQLCTESGSREPDSARSSGAWRLRISLGGCRAEQVPPTRQCCL